MMAHKQGSAQLDPSTQSSGQAATAITYVTVRSGSLLSQPVEEGADIAD
jgi:hypothetical protein